MDRLSRVMKGIDEDSWQLLVAFATKNLEPGLLKAFIEALFSVRESITPAQVARLMRNPDALGQVAMGIFSKGKVYDTMFEGIQTALNRSGKYWAESSSIPVSFNTHHPQVLVTAKEQTFELIQQIGETTRAGIKEAVIQGLEAGVNPRDTARQIRGMIGLTQRQARAVANYRRLLTHGDPEALERALRDKRTDRAVMRAIEQNKPMDPDYIEKLVSRYETRYIQYRAEVIARTESLTALNRSQQLLWEQAVENEDVEPDTMYRRWFVADPCPICAQIPGMNAAGVGLTEPFVTPNGLIPSPPVHPQCKCVVFTRPRIRRAA